MKPTRKLLQDVLSEASDPWRQEIFETSLGELRRKRRLTRMRKAWPLAMAAVLVLSTCLAYVLLPHRSRQEAHIQVEPASPSPALAYPPIEVVTNHWPSMAVVESSQYQSVIVDNSMVQGPLEVLNDTELLALFPGKPVGLLADAQGLVQLVFLDPRDKLLVR